MGGGEVAGGLWAFLTSQAYLAGRGFHTRTINDSYPSGLVAEPVLLLAKLKYEGRLPELEG